MHIGAFQFPSPALALAPMAGVTDRPFRMLCKRLGADLAATEMTTSDASLWQSRKSVLRRDHLGEPDPISVQIAGYDPQMLAEAARFNVEHGAQIIDINMGCPAKKVCKVWAGSALLQDEPLVARILQAVVAAVAVPVTLKIRLGYSRDQKNALQIAKIAADTGIAALAVHGRTRDMHYEGEAEYDLIAQIKQQVALPLLANGDITDAHKAAAVLQATGADGLMIGRAAQGRPWIFRSLRHFLQTGVLLPEPSRPEIGAILLDHMQALYDFYGEAAGVRIARKHLSWYAKAEGDSAAYLRTIQQTDRAAVQLEAAREFFWTPELAAA